MNDPQHNGTQVVEFTDLMADQMDEYDKSREQKIAEVVPELYDPKFIAYNNALKKLVDRKECNNFLDIEKCFDDLGLEVNEPVPVVGRITVLLQAFLLTKPDDKAYRQCVRWFLAAKNGGI